MSHATDERRGHLRWIDRLAARLQRQAIGPSGAARQGVADGETALRHRRARRIDNIVEGLHARAASVGGGGFTRHDEVSSGGVPSIASPPNVLRLVFSKRTRRVLDTSVPPPVIGSLDDGSWGKCTPRRFTLMMTQHLPCTIINMNTSLSVSILILQVHRVMLALPP